MCDGSINIQYTSLSYLTSLMSLSLSILSTQFLYSARAALPSASIRSNSKKRFARIFWLSRNPRLILVRGSAPSIYYFFFLLVSFFFFSSPLSSNLSKFSKPKRLLWISMKRVVRYWCLICLFSCVHVSLTLSPPRTCLSRPYMSLSPVHVSLALPFLCVSPINVP